MIEHSYEKEYVEITYHVLQDFYLKYFYLKYFYHELLHNIHAIDVTCYIYKSHGWNVETFQVWNRETYKYSMSHL